MIIKLKRERESLIRILVMNLANAEPDLSWGQWPCEGMLPSTLTLVSAGSVAARRTHPGLGAAPKGSNVADRNPRSYGGQGKPWPEPRRNYDARQACSSPAAASKTTILAPVPVGTDRRRHAGHRPIDVMVGVIDDPFIAPEQTNA